MVGNRTLAYSGTPTGAWLIAVGVLLCGMAVYLHGFIQTLPYQLEPDEPNLWLRANALAARGEINSFYPPLGILELALEHRLLNVLTPQGGLTLPAYYVTGRTISVLHGMLLLALTYQAGRQLHSRAAGAAAMLFLIAQPDALAMAKLLKVDTLAWVFGMAALLLSIHAVRRKRLMFLIPAFAAGLAAAGTKYTMLPVLGVPGALLILYGPRNTRERIIAGGLGIGIVVAVIFAVANPPPLLIALIEGESHIGQLYDRGVIFRFVSLSRAVSPMLQQLGRLNLLVVLIGLPAAVAMWPRARLTARQWVFGALLLLMMAATFLLLGLFQTNRVQDRYVIVLGFALLWGLAIALATREHIEFALPLAVALLIPWLIRGWQYGMQLTQPDTRAMTADWFIAHVPEGTRIAAEKDHVEFERTYGGFPSEKIFFVEEIDSVYDRSLEDFARSGVEYLIADFRNIYRGGFFEPKRDNSVFLAQVETVLDLSRPWDRGWQGPERYVFRIPPMQHVPRHVFLGDAVIFKGYDLASQTVAQGETIGLTLYWAALRDTDANYTVFAHLTGSEGALIAQLDAPPGDALHRTYDWPPGYFDWDEWPIQVPADALPGTYMLRIGMYDADTLVRLPAVDADGTPLGDSVLLTEITVTDRP